LAVGAEVVILLLALVVQVFMVVPEAEALQPEVAELPILQVTVGMVHPQPQRAGQPPVVAVAAVTLARRAPALRAA
jgi:hypothetical protein